MQKLIIILTLILSACSSKIGNYSNASPSISEAMASDVSSYLHKAYSPAKTQFNFDNEIQSTDYFGLTLQDNLRQKGFAIKLSPKNNKQLNQENMESDSRLLNISVKYIVDTLDHNSYRVTLYLSDAVISRAYSTEQGNFTSLGSWVRGN
ncbi:hypothetical protein [Pasteurella multocida]|uniref:hypothetical protein n=1 Tax=Pasteurella multocida TaxID=747 RepID=UPI0013F47B62|nr:hypothetical protein [Pasteurella multocida]